MLSDPVYSLQLDPMPLDWKESTTAEGDGEGKLEQQPSLLHVHQAILSHEIKIWVITTEI